MNYLLIRMIAKARLFNKRLSNITAVIPTSFFQDYYGHGLFEESK